jgi:hypothetical protein
LLKSFDYEYLIPQTPSPEGEGEYSFAESPLLKERGRKG